MHKKVQFKTIGMQRDLSESAFNSKFAYENYNIRITAQEDNTLLSITNEKGNKEVIVKDFKGYTVTLTGTPIGQTVINDEWVLFFTGKEDVICKLTASPYNDLPDGTEYLHYTELYRGDLNFDTEHLIETLTFVENENIKKVYWVDGKNPPRVIDIQKTYLNVNKSIFNFNPDLDFKESITITKNNFGGTFSPGVIQYAFTYFNKYGQESAIFYTSPLYYTSFSDRGGSPEDKVSNSFDIKIQGPFTSLFEYLRVYSIQRTSINSTPEIKKVADLKVNQNASLLLFTDSGIIGESIDPTELLYKGGEDIIANTISQKDNTLFLGGITLNKKALNIKDVKFPAIEFLYDDTKKLIPPSKSSYYPYKSQLDKNSSQIKTFKYLETYRFGIQLQHSSGKWSEPIFIADVQNDKPVKTIYNANFSEEGWDIELPGATLELNTAEDTITAFLNDVSSQGYKNIRPVIVYPNINDRDVICQGILCPTVYNVKDRNENGPFVQSSWFIRPNMPQNVGELELELNDVNSNPKEGAWTEFRHNVNIPGRSQFNGEIMNINGIKKDINTSSTIIEGGNIPPYVINNIDKIDTTDKYVENLGHYYHVDQSIFTLHSPDLEFNTDLLNLDYSDVKLRIVGMVPLTSFISDIDIQTSTPPKLLAGSAKRAKGFYKTTVGKINNTREIAGSYGLISGPFWWDEEPYQQANTDLHQTSYVIYPWHKGGSLNGGDTTENISGVERGQDSLLSKKILSNLKYSFKTQYITNPNNIWNAYDFGKNSDKLGISGVTIFNSNEMTLQKIPRPLGSSLIEDLVYYGNVDKISLSNYAYCTMEASRDAEYNYTFHRTASTTHVDDNQPDVVMLHNNPISIKYKSTPHAVIALNYAPENPILEGEQNEVFYKQRILPNLGGLNDMNTNIFSTEDNTRYLFWDRSIKSISQDTIPMDAFKFDTINNPSGTLENGWLWLGELYRDNVANKFGGDSKEAMANNQWLPCGEPISLHDNNGNIKSSLIIKWTEGDTYYQRYDHLKTYPYTQEDTNSIVEIVSFMCETQINLDGRYDKNRGLSNNLFITPENFNKINDAYSQQNNYFNYRNLSYYSDLDKFLNTITWTKTKTAAALVDTWTNITLASTLDLEGDKGPLTALRNFNNQLIAFQESGISQIMYNENMQISTTAGLPIEIANSGKVTGKRYITDSVGCKNKHSICTTPQGLYFIDDLNKSIYAFDGKIKNLSSSLGFNSWVKKVLADSSKFSTYYDKINNDVLFINKDTCLAYSELVGQFTSFYSYNGLSYCNTFLDHTYSIKDNTIWKHGAGEYNSFYGEHKPFYTTVLVNPDISKDKVFNNIEYRADIWDKNGVYQADASFDKLEVWNEYQRGESDLQYNKNTPSNLKKKFRIWRANIPRDESNKRDRIRNPWIYLKLSKEQYNTDKLILHDLIVNYFE